MKKTESSFQLVVDDKIWDRFNASNKLEVVRTGERKSMTAKLIELIENYNREMLGE